MVRPIRRHVPPVVVSLADQGVISAGTFVFNVVLARAVPLSDYGRFALLVGNLLLLQTICGSLVFYPLSIRGAALDGPERKCLTVTALALAMALGVPLAAALSMALWPYIGAEFVLPAFAVFVCAQAQEATRRGLLTGFRYGAAIPGDLLSYGGQAALLLVATRHLGCSLQGALWIMASTSLAAAALQLPQIGLKGVRLSPPIALACDFWDIGRWTLASNLLGIAKALSLPWLLTAMAGPTAAGAFQIALNLSNVANPVVIGVCNVVPQMAARAFRFGYRAAWIASWPAIAAGFVPVTGFASLLLVDPQRICALVYGERPELAGVAVAIRFLAIGMLFNYLGSGFFSYLCGVLAGRLALLADCASTLAMGLLLPPLILVCGSDGGAAALAVSLAVRAILLGVDTAKRAWRAEGGAGDDMHLMPGGQETAA